MNTKVKKIFDFNLHNQRVLIREDLNVPLTPDGKISDDSRIQAALPTLKYAVDQGAKVMVVSHLGRPKEGVFDAALSLAPVQAALQAALGVNVKLVSNALEEPPLLAPGDIVLLENVRFLPGEKSNDPVLSQKLAQLCDIFVMDAFATAHRAEASTCGVIHYAPIACAGPLLLAELEALDRALAQPKSPVVAIVGGSKVSTKFALLSRLASQVDCLIVGGGIANTFLAAAGFPVGASLYEPQWVQEAKQLLLAASSQKSAKIPLPVDVVVATEIQESAKTRTIAVAEITADEKILDIGPKTIALYGEIIKSAQTILWNGPVGVFEMEPFSQGTRAIAMAVAQSAAFSLAGGGDTVAALNQFNLKDQIAYVSTGGGAFLEYLQGDLLPALVALEQR